MGHRLGLTLIFLTTSLMAKTIYETQFSARKNWVTSFSSSDQAKKNIIYTLAKSQYGKRLLFQAKEKAARYGLTLLDVIKVGHVSITDTTLTRRFSPSRPDSVVYESKSIVYINREHNQLDALLDLAHELTHFVYRRDFNPYDQNYSMDEFIKGTIEGKGGEANAFLTECLVLNELFSGKMSKRKQCSKILTENSSAGRLNNAISLFYQLGSFYSRFVGEVKNVGLTEEFKEISDKDVAFFSSAWSLPYPMAALREYKTIMKKVCDNDQKRMKYFDSTKSRRPASLEPENFHRKCKRHI